MKSACLTVIQDNKWKKFLSVFPNGNLGEVIKKANIANIKTDGWPHKLSISHKSIKDTISQTKEL